MKKTFLLFAFLCCTTLFNAQERYDIESEIEKSYANLLDEVYFYLDAYSFSENVEGMREETDRLATKARNLRSVTVDVFDIDEDAQQNFQLQLLVASAADSECPGAGYALQQIAVNEYAQKERTYRPKVYFKLVDLYNRLDDISSRRKLSNIQRLNNELEYMLSEQ